MRVTAIHAQTERKGQDMSVRCAEKRRCQARMLWVHGPIRATSGVCAIAQAARRKKCLFNRKNQAIFKPDRGNLGNVGLNDLNFVFDRQVYSAKMTATPLR